MNRTVITRSREETRKLARKLIKGTRVLALYGELGSGKTTFAQGIGEALGIKQRIISPTFIIVRSYKLSLARSHLARLTSFYHIDLYRIESEKELEGLGIEEILNDKNAVVVIEWAEKLGLLLPKSRIDIRFKYVDENKRRILISNF